MDVVCYWRGKAVQQNMRRMATIWKNFIRILTTSYRAQSRKKERTAENKIDKTQYKA